MAVPSKNKFRKKTTGSSVAAWVILFLILAIAAGYFMFSPSRKTITLQKAKPSHVMPIVPDNSIPQNSVQPLPIIPPSVQKKQNEYPPATAFPDNNVPDTGRGDSARLAIIIDDMGSNLSEAHSLAAIKVPLTFAIIPGLRNDKGVAAFAAGNKIETMIHIPMQSKGWPARRLESNGLLVSMDAAELQGRVNCFLEQFPGAVGINNHMGSEFTEQDEKMSVVLQLLKKNDLFFIDSVTSPESAGLRVARQLGVRTARRNVFLDNELERTYIIGQLNQAITLARKKGSAIAICHPHPATIAALTAALPTLAGKGIHLVPVSQLVQ